MGKRTSYAPGAFCRVDLATTDARAAKSFYASVFGWEMEDSDAGDGAVYTICRRDGDAVCGLFELTEEMRSTGAPPNWTSYVSVAGADAAVARAWARQVGAAARHLGGEGVPRVSRRRGARRAARAQVERYT
jgi:predicted enzyme related to lactoylglutathione lyase